MEGLERQYLAYFDVLGYKSFFEEGKDVDRLFSSIVDLASQVIDARSPDAFGSMGFSAITFSDNYAIAVKPDGRYRSETHVVGTLIALMALIQLLCISRYSLLIRGCVCYGPLYVDDSVIFGEALIRAVALEAETFYPRIQIDDEVMGRLSELGDLSPSELFIGNDFDGRYFINSLALISDEAEESWVVEVARGLSGILIPANASTIRTIIEHMVGANCRFSHNVTDWKKIAAKESIIRKHCWLVEHFNTFCEETGAGQSVSCYPFLNKRLMRFELRLSSRCYVDCGERDAFAGRFNEPSSRGGFR